MKLPKNGVKMWLQEHGFFTHNKLDKANAIRIRIFSEADAKELLEIKRVYGSDYYLYKNIKAKKKGK